jgi:hypothetical protein
MTMQPMGLIWPDTPTEVVNYLKTVLDSEVKVAIDLTGWRRPQPAVQVHQRGGWTEGIRSNARLQVDIRHNTHDLTRDLMDLTKAHLLMLPVKVPGVLQSTEYVGPQAIPDNDRKPRLMLTWDVVTRGVPLP